MSNINESSMPEQQNQETSWGKIIVIGIIMLIALAIVILGLLQNFVALKAISSLPNALNSLNDSVMTSESVTRDCYQNDVKIDCSIIDDLRKGGVE